MGIARSRSRVPELRSRRVVTEVTRNITMNGKIASSPGPKRSKSEPGMSRNIHHSKVIRTHGSTSSIAAVRRSRRSWVSTRTVTARRMRALIRGPRGVGRRRSEAGEAKNAVG
jgi:hypothetical protein